MANTETAVMGELDTGNAVPKSEADLISFDTVRFGRLKVSGDRLLSFPSGILGFPDIKSLVMLDYENEDVPFKWLQSIDKPDVAFVVIDPLLIKPDYSLNLKKTGIADIGSAKDEDFAILVIMTITEGKSKGMTANLRAPLIINSVIMRGKQLVLDNANYPVRYPLFH